MYISNCQAQDSPPATESEGVVAVGKQFLRDEGKLWTSPLHMTRNDLKWVVPLGIGAAALLTADRNISTEIGEDRSIQKPSHDVSQAGTSPLYITPVALIVIGRLTQNQRTTHAGSVTLQAVLHSGVIVQALKFATNRERPDKTQGAGGFWDGGKSFPSGHAMTSWAFASAMSDQFPDKKWIRFSSYAMASAVSISRVSGQNHYSSDVLVGAALGWLVGHYVSRQHQ
jgi:hypothetical protein